jgi:hypothetical protein
MKPNPSVLPQKSCLSRGFHNFPIFFMPFLQHFCIVKPSSCGAHNLPAPGRSFGAHHPCSAIFLRQLRRELGPTGLSSDAAEDLTYNYLGDPAISSVLE